MSAESGEPLAEPDGEEDSQDGACSRCEWGHDDYSLNVENLPSLANTAPKPVRPAAPQGSLFDGAGGLE